MTKDTQKPRRSRRRDPNASPPPKRKQRKDVVTAPADLNPAGVVKADGTGKAVRSDGTVDKRGGYRPGAGRKPIHKRLTNYDKAMNMLDDSIEDALQVLIDGLQDEDKYYKIRCAELLLKKTVADKKQNEHVGPGGGPIQIEKKDLEEAILEIDHMINTKIQDAEFSTVEE